MSTTTELEAALAASRQLDAANALSTSEIYAFVLVPKAPQAGSTPGYNPAPQIVVNQDNANFSAVLAAYEDGLGIVKTASQDTLDTAAANVVASSGAIDAVPVG